MPTPAVERRELPQYARPQTPPPSVAAPQSYPVAPAQQHAGVSGGGRGLASYAPPQQPQLEHTGSVGPKSVAATPKPAAQGGTTIIVGTSDTLDILAKRYNVSQAAILQANGYKGPRALSPGQQLIIPRPATTAAAAPALAPPVSKPVAVAAPTVHIVNRGDTLNSIARRNHVPVGELARANNLDQSAKLSLGMKITVPGAKSAAVEPCSCVPRSRSPRWRRPLRAPGRAASATAERAPGAIQPVRWKKSSPSLRSLPSRAKPPAHCRRSAGRCAAR